MKKLSTAIGGSVEVQAELDALVENRLGRERKRLQREHAREIERLTGQHIATVAELKLRIIQLEQQLQQRGWIDRLFSRPDRRDDPSHRSEDHAADRHDPETQ